MTRNVEVTVESLGGLGDGIATFDGKPLFIPKSCPGDRLDIAIVHENQDGLHGTITRILSPGTGRQSAPCVYFDRCGGCTLQHLAPEHYRTFKTQMLHSALQRAGFPMPQAEVTFIRPDSRRRVEFKVSHESGKPLLAFHEPRSHRAVMAEQCLVLTPALQAMIAPINRVLPEFPQSRHLFSVSLTASDTGIDMLLTFKDCNLKALPSFQSLCESLSLARICVRTPEEKPVVSAALSPVAIRLGNHLIPLPPAAFLQATNEGQSILTDFALKATAGASMIADLFCGIGTYSFPMSEHSKVHAFEGDGEMVSAMTSAAAKGGAKNISAYQRDLFKRPLDMQELLRFDAVVINPPRLGAKAQAGQLARSTIGKVVMISCNPATFARDARLLKEGGFMLAAAGGVDQFVWNQHLEIVSVFTR